MNDKRRVFQALTLISQLGISIVVPVLLCTFLGTWLEKKISFPVFIPLVILGVLAGLRNAYELLRPVIGGSADEKGQSTEKGAGDSDGEAG